MKASITMSRALGWGQNGSKVNSKGLSAQIAGKVNEVLRVSGVPGLAVGIIRNGEIFYEDYFGYRDVHRKLKPDRDTIFYLASLTKAMTAAALGILVDKGLLEWDTAVHDILPDLSSKTWLCDSKLTVADLLSHRSGAAWGDALYLQSNNHIMLPKSESIRTFDSLAVVAPPRSKYMYNNHAYNIAGLVLERISNQNFGDFVKQQLFDPLEMKRTYTYQPDEHNVALAYNILQDKTAHEIPFCEASDQTMMFAGQSVRSSMGDLLRFYRAYTKAMSEVGDIEINNVHSHSNGSSGSPVSNFLCSCPGLLGIDRGWNWKRKDMPHPSTPFKQIATIVRPHIARPIDSLFEQTYALGWNRTQLPGKLEFGANSSMVHSTPRMGEKYPGNLALWHGGNMPGTSAAVCLLPSSQTAIVVLQNSLGLCDAAEWICELILDVLFTGSPQNDYVSLARESTKNGSDRMQKVQEELDRHRIPGTSHRPLTAYTGRYWNSIHNWVIEISLDAMSRGIDLKFQAREDELYHLRHYHNDTFTWNLSYDETVKRAQYCRPVAYYKLEFESTVKSGEGEISQLRWRHDPAVPEGEIFLKEDQFYARGM